MAADTQMTSCNRKFRTTKVFRLPCGGLFGGTGSGPYIMQALRWVEAGCDLDDKPDLSSDEADIECIVVLGSGKTFLLHSHLEPMELCDPFVAIGSGGCVAVGAMAMGADAIEAVKVAARFDAATSEPVESWTLEKPRKVAKKAAKKVAKKK